MGQRFKGHLLLAIYVSNISNSPVFVVAYYNNDSLYHYVVAIVITASQVKGQLNVNSI